MKLHFCPRRCLSRISIWEDYNDRPDMFLAIRLSPALVAARRLDTNSAEKGTQKSFPSQPNLVMLEFDPS